MQRLVADLLTLSTLERLPDEGNEECLDVHDMLEALVDEARTLSAERHAISLHLDGPQYLRAVAVEIESAVRNLLTNAIRYTPDGGTIDVTWMLRDDEGWIRVRDTGIGIGVEHLPRIAERFYRVDRGRSRATGGTGLGLAITKRIVMRHQGRLQIDSVAGAGSTFTLRLPAARLAASRPTSGSHAALAAAEAAAPADVSQQGQEDPPA